MFNVFISYRREDSEAHAGRIYDRMVADYGEKAVFMDIDAIPIGVDFREHLDQAVGKCDVLLAVIGENWLEVCFKDGPKQGQRRLDDPTDIVRIEIVSALDRGIPVIPVLVGKASMPSEANLPDCLKKLAFRNAAEVRSGRDFRDHVSRLIRGIEHLRKANEEKVADKQRQELLLRQQEEETRQKAELERKRRDEEEAERQREELERLQKEGEAKLAVLVREALDRTQGKPTKDDNAAAKEMCKQHHMDKERAKQIVEEVREQWQKAHPPKLERKPGENITNSLGMKFAWIPPGTFWMGSPKDEKERQANETQHKVTLSRGFFIGVHLVTQDQWQAVMGSHPSGFKGEKTLPVETVSWNECQQFIKKLRDKDGKAYRLPTEAEWEYACRAGTTTPFHFGETISTDQVNYDGNATYGNGNKGVYRKKTTPVGRFPANAFGIFDMHGNLWEWCQDWYGDYPQKDVIDPKGPDAGQYRVLRGGSWSYHPRHCRSAARFKYEPSDRDRYCGFRLCFFVE